MFIELYLFKKFIDEIVQVFFKQTCQSGIPGLKPKIPTHDSQRFGILESNVSETIIFTFGLKVDVSNNSNGFEDKHRSDLINIRTIACIALYGQSYIIWKERTKEQKEEIIRTGPL